MKSLFIFILTFNIIAQELCDAEVFIGPEAEKLFNLIQLYPDHHQEALSNPFSEHAFTRITVWRSYKLKESKTIFDEYCQVNVVTDTASRTTTCLHEEQTGRVKCEINCALSYLEPCDYY